MTGPGAHPSRVRAAVPATILAAALLASLVGLSGALPWVDAALLSALLVLLPLLAVIQVPLATGAEVRRVPAYVGSMATILTLGLASLLVGARRGGVEALGITAIPVGSGIGWTLGLAASGLAVIGAFRVMALRWGIPESPLLRELLPRTRGERWMFAAVSLAAGTGEELAYRGYAIPALAAVTGGLWSAAILTSLVFGVLHAYQGPLGIVRTAVMGGVLAAGYLLSGSLWPSMIAHTLIDLVAGIFLADRLVGGPGCGGVCLRVRCRRVLPLPRHR